MLCQHCGQREATIHEVLIDPDGVRLEKHVCEACEAALAGMGPSGFPGDLPMLGVLPPMGPKAPGPTIIIAGGPTVGPGAVTGPVSASGAGPIGPMIQAVVGATIAGKLGQVLGASGGVSGGPMGGESPGGASAGLAACPSCGLTFAQFRQTGMLGCGSCYEAFADRLGPLIERTHEGAACHVGKAPVRAVFPGDAVPTSGDGGPAVRDRAGALTELRRRLRTAIAAERFEAAAQIREEIRRVSLGQADAEASGGRDA